MSAERELSVYLFYKESSSLRQEAPVSCWCPANFYVTSRAYYACSTATKPTLIIIEILPSDDGLRVAHTTQFFASVRLSQLGKPQAEGQSAWSAGKELVYKGGLHGAENVISH